MAPPLLSLRRDMSVPVNQVLAFRRLGSEYASFAFKGSSTINVSPPNPVNVAPTEVAMRKPPAVVTNPSSVILTSLVAKSLRYKSDCISLRHCAPR